MKRFLSLVIWCSLPLLAQQPTLTITNPQQTWRWDYANIADATISIHPKGAFSLVHLYLDITPTTGWASWDTLEIMYAFDLPASAQVTDLWLWVEDKIMQGYILDRWTASNIYENIVRRRRDPALLVKESDTRYVLRVYPLSSTGRRRFRISYLMPNQLTSTSTAINLPLYLLRPQRPFSRDLSILYWPDSLTGPAAIPALPQVTGASRLDSVDGPYQEFVIPASALSSSASLVTGSAFRNDLAVRKYDGPGDAIYQLAVTPSKVFGLNFSRRVTVLIDYVSDRTIYTAEQLRTALRSALTNGLTPSDTFCLISGNVFGALPVGGGWFAADEHGIAAAFDSLRPSYFTGTSNLPVLLRAGVDSALKTPASGLVWLLAGSSAHGDYTTANQILSELVTISAGAIPVHIANVSNLNPPAWWFNGRQWIGNEYLYDNLARLTGGTFTTYSSQPILADHLTTSMSRTAGVVESFDLTTSLASGFVYGRVSPGDVPLRSVDVHTPVIQLGRFVGSAPLQVDVAGRFRGAVVSRRILVPADSIAPGDRTDYQLWAGFTIGALRQQPQTNSLVNQMIGLSLDARVLSSYTAFLALEPSDTVLPCLTCRDETKLTSVETNNDPEVDSLLSAFPNPFNAQTTLRVTLPADTRPEEVSLKIYNLLGQEVFVFDPSTLQEGGSRTFLWNGLNGYGAPVATGVYVAVLQTPNRRHTLKLVMVK